jgi:uncharacterized protein YecE (DUF72 family)
MAGTVRIGISGWTYAPWRGKFYPAKLPHRAELSYAARSFSTIEINGTFYSLQRSESFARWAAETPDDFVFSVKGSRYITHSLRLRGVDGALANFFASGLLRLGKKLGPILWQFPPNFRFDPERFDAFFSMLPHDMKHAAALAAQHDGRLRSEAWTEVCGRNRKVRHAVEIRHESFVCEEFIQLLRRHRIALVCADTVEWPRLMDATADFIYCRLHGSKELYTSGYSARDLKTWADRIETWAAGGEVIDGDRASSRSARRRSARDVYVYFDNDVKVLAPRNARALARRLQKSAAHAPAAKHRKMPAS